MKIEVTQKDIDLGVPEDTCNCPVARAAKRVLGARRYPFLEVSDERIYLHSGWWEGKPLPEDARQFIRDFDRGWTVEPFTFSLEETA